MRKQRTSDAPPPPLIVDPSGIYRAEFVRAALGLRASSLRREWREGRLRVVRRCNKNFLLGADILKWLDSGELASPATKRNHQGNGRA